MNNKEEFKINKIENYLNYIFSDYPQTSQLKEIKAELNLNLQEKYNDYINEGIESKEAFDKAVKSLGDIDELIESFNLSDSTSYYSENVNEYILEITSNDEVFREKNPKNAFKVALGLFIILNGLAVVGFLDSSANEMIRLFGVTYFFVTIAIGVGLFVVTGLSISQNEFKSVFSDQQISEFEKDQKVIRTIKSLKDNYKEIIAKNNVLLVIGIIIVIIGVGSTALVEKINNVYVPLYFFTLVGIGTALIVYAGMNRNMSSELNTDTKSVTKNKVDAYSSIIMLVATIVFLFFGFIFNMWHPMWVVFPICGISIGIYEAYLARK